VSGGIGKRRRTHWSKKEMGSRVFVEGDGGAPTAIKRAGLEKGGEPYKAGESKKEKQGESEHNHQNEGLIGQKRSIC